MRTGITQELGTTTNKKVMKRGYTGAYVAGEGRKKGGSKVKTKKGKIWRKGKDEG